MIRELTEQERDNADEPTTCFQSALPLLNLRWRGRDRALVEDLTLLSQPRPSAYSQATVGILEAAWECGGL